jgi:hypothetical protein
MWDTDSIALSGEIEETRDGYSRGTNLREALSSMQLSQQYSSLL